MVLLPGTVQKGLNIRLGKRNVVLEANNHETGHEAVPLIPSWQPG